MAARNSTGNTRPVAIQDGMGKIDQVRALIAGAMAMLQDSESEETVEARIILKKARHDAQIVRLLLEGLSLTEAEEFERGEPTEAANG